LLTAERNSERCANPESPTEDDNPPGMLAKMKFRQHTDHDQGSAKAELEIPNTSTTES
jgi:hypothetical protein